MNPFDQLRREIAAADPGNHYLYVDVIYALIERVATQESPAIDTERLAHAIAGVARGGHVLSRRDRRFAASVAAEYERNRWDR